MKSTYKINHLSQYALAVSTKQNEENKHSFVFFRYINMLDFYCCIPNKCSGLDQPTLSDNFLEQELCITKLDPLLRVFQSCNQATDWIGFLGSYEERSMSKFIPVGSIITFWLYDSESSFLLPIKYKLPTPIVLVQLPGF